MPPESIVLMGPFGAGKSFLGRRLRERGIADYVELEPVVHERFGSEEGFDVEAASAFIRQHYFERLESGRGPFAFESTGVTQRPLLREVTRRFRVALVRVRTPKATCLARVAARHSVERVEAEIANAERFFERWEHEIAPTYVFAVEVSGTNAESATRQIAALLDPSG